MLFFGLRGPCDGFARATFNQSSGAGMAGLGTLESASVLPFEVYKFSRDLGELYSEMSDRVTAAESGDGSLALSIRGLYDLESVAIADTSLVSESGLPVLAELFCNLYNSTLNALRQQLGRFGVFRDTDSIINRSFDSLMEGAYSVGDLSVWGDGLLDIRGAGSSGADVVSVVVNGLYNVESIAFGDIDFIDCDAFLLADLMRSAISYANADVERRVRDSIALDLTMMLKNV